MRFFLTYVEIYWYIGLFTLSETGAETETGTRTVEDNRS